MSAICKHAYPADLCGTCNPPPKQDKADDACRVSSVCRQLRAERDEARRLAEFWHEVACGKFVTPNGLPWKNQTETKP